MGKRITIKQVMRKISKGKKLSKREKEILKRHQKRKK